MTPIPYTAMWSMPEKSRYGEIICPPGFFGWPVKGGGLEAGELMGKVLGAVFESGMMRILDGGVDYDFYLPVRAGDTLVVYGKVRRCP